MDREKCLIWGFGKGGRETFERLSSVKEISVIGFCDNNKKLIGKKYKEVPVLDFDNLCTNDFDYIVIGAPSVENEVYNQLLERTEKPVVKNVGELLDRRFSIDISGWCNAKCKWCVTGRKNLKNSPEREYMSFDSFVQVYAHMRKIGLLHPYNEIMLYSWGEPFLNPDYEKIVCYLYSEKQVFSISTNASVLKCLDGDIPYYRYCKTVVFSMPGFSQESYDRIHGFKLDVIKNNISKLIENMRKHGFEGKALISYHVYQFNENELINAQNFAEELQISIEPVVAYFASHQLSIAYLKNELSEEIEKEAKAELIMNHIHQLILQRPDNYQCLVKNVVSIHWDGRVELCCCCDDSAKDFLWKDIREIKNLFEWQKYRNRMMTSNTCIECRKLGLDYWFFNNPIYGRK